MKPTLALLLATLLVPFIALGAPYKEVMKESVKSKQPTVYARASEHGFGLQYVNWNPRGGGGLGFVGGLAGGLAGGIIGNELDRLAHAGPSALAKEDVELLAALYDREAAQRQLESALAGILPGVALFADPPVIKPLAVGSPAGVAAYSEDPVLVIELYSSLITDYRGLQVTAVVYELSAAELAANPKAPSPGRVYRNRFDFVSNLLPAPHVKTPEEIKADVETVKAKYRGRKLTKEQREQQREELEEAKNGTTLKQWREPLMAEWLASGGAKLHEAQQLGIATVIELLARDLLDFTPVESRKVDKLGWRILRDVVPGSGRYTSIFVGGPFAGALISEPSGLSVEYCEGTAFSARLPRDTWPPLCANEQKPASGPAGPRS
jgi:hypothetical protein